MATLLGVVLLSLTVACSRSSVDPPLQQAVDELTKLQSACNAGINGEQFENRFLTAKGNIDAALAKTADKGAKVAFVRAIAGYQSVYRAFTHGMELEAKLNAASEQADQAKSYALANAVGRAQIERRWAAEEEADAFIRAEKRDAEVKQQQAEAARAKEIEKSQLAYENQLQKDKAAALAQAAQAETQAGAQAEADKPRLAEAARRENERRFAPDGIVYNLKLIKIARGNAVIPAGTELILVKKNGDKTIHVKWGKIEADVLANDITNDRDWVAAYKNLHRDDEIR